MTAAGQRLSVTLVDGTQFTLAPASRVGVAADYGRLGARRDVELEGEAYFVVAHDAAHPFAVRAHGAVARDIGTAFDMRAYPEDAGARIAVAEGAVVVRAEMRRPGSRLLSPVSPLLSHAAELRVGDVATISDVGIAVQHRADIAGLTGWMQGKLVFNGTPLGEAVREVGRMFGVRVTVADSVLATEPLNGAFDDATVDGVLDAITGVVGGRYERVGDTMVIRRRAAGTRRRGPEGQAPLTTVQNREPQA